MTALPAASEETAALGPFGLDEAVTYALLHHPTLRAQVAQDDEQRALVAAARSSYLPRLDLSLQINAGTGNVLRGPLFSMPNIPAVSGPPTGRSIGDVAFGTLVGVGASWDALGLVGQIAQVDAAMAGEAQARAAVDVQRLTIAYAAADQFLDLVSQEEITRAATASVERARTLATVTDALVAQQLRPGADGSRAKAELALATTQLVNARRANAVSRTTLARALGAAGRSVAIRARDLLSTPSSVAQRTTKNPSIVQADATVRITEAQKRVARWQYLPRLDVVASLWVRGSGLSNGGGGSLPPSPTEGITPDTPNWAAGLVLSWPALEVVAVHARTRAAQARAEAARAQRADVEQAVQNQIDVAEQVLEGAKAVAANTPIALEAARATESQAIARYRAGLATIVEVAEAERLLTIAEADDAVARINTRRAELLLARAVGDLEPFFAQVRGGGR